MNGYEYTWQLKAKIAESPTHTLDLGDAIDFISFYGLRNLFNAQGDIRFVGQVAIDVLDKAITYNEICWSVKSEELSKGVRTDECIPSQSAIWRIHLR